MTTANIYSNAEPSPSAPTPKDAIAERMARMRAAKVAKRSAAQALAQAGGPLPTTPVAPPALEEAVSVSAPQTSERLKTILRELRTMFGYGSPRGSELCAEALALLE
jgi:hypothetical protein